VKRNSDQRRVKENLDQPPVGSGELAPHLFCERTQFGSSQPKVVLCDNRSDLSLAILAAAGAITRAFQRD